MAVKPAAKIINPAPKSQIDNFINKGGKVEEEVAEIITTTIRIPKDLLEKIDKYCKETYQTRQAFFIQAILKFLQED